MPINQRIPWKISYGKPLEEEIERLSVIIEQHPAICGRYQPRWLALKLLEGESELAAAIPLMDGGVELMAAVQESQAGLSAHMPGGIDIAIADKRYAFVNQVVQGALTQSTPYTSLSERLDRVVTNPWLGMPIFFFIMYLVFNLVVNVSAPYLDWIDAAISGPVSSWVYGLLMMVNAPGWLQGLVLDGIIAGVGGVLVFIPGLMALFLFIALLEDSGYMARAAFVMHRMMSRIGLSGKSFVALILGFGCAVPAIYATRTLDTFRDRVLTGLLVPLMSCAARLPVYVVFGIAFFGRSADVVVWALYALGISVAAFSAWLLSRTVLKHNGQDMPFLLELPSYRIPSLRSLWIYMSQKTGGFLKNATTVILSASIVIWILLNLPLGAQDVRSSWFGRLSAVIAPALAPAGFGSWEASGSLVTGLIAKEVVVSTMSQIYTGGDGAQRIQMVGFAEGLSSIADGFIDASRRAGAAILETFVPFARPAVAEGDVAVHTGLGAALQREFTPLAALSFLVFVLLYVPCIATLAAIRAEFGLRWAAFSALYQTGIAWALAVAVFQFGTLLGFA